MSDDPPTFPSRRRRPRHAKARALYPFAWRTPVLLVPGLGDSGPGHWQSLWEERYPDAHRAVQDDFDRPDVDVWARRVATAIAASATPPVVVAHSFGCLAFARAVLAHGARVPGALLVAPADPARFGIAEAALAAPLPLASTLVASTNDPWLKFVKAGALATQWGSRLASVGACGHLNVQSGHGEWPAGLALLRDVAERVAASGALACAARAHPRTASSSLQQVRP